MPRSSQIQQARYQNLPPTRMPRSTFRKDHRWKAPFDEGNLYPILCDEILPGDTIRLRIHMFARLLTALVPIFDVMRIHVHAFFVPYRLCWDNFEAFMGEVEPGSSTEYQIPVIQSGAFGFPLEGLADFCGFPPGIINKDMTCWEMRSYQLIWNEWYRAAQIQDSITVLTGDGPDASSGYVLKKINKPHDYFTALLPYPAAGDGAVIPLLDTVDVGVNPLDATVITGPDQLEALGGSSNVVQFENPVAGGSTPLVWDAVSGTNLQVDLSTASGIPINDLRESVAVQRLLERDARGGLRYPEQILVHWGVVSDDARLQRPEFLGGGSSEVDFVPVPQTSETGTTEQGNLAAYAKSQGSTPTITKTFTEHGTLMVLMAVRGDLSYSQGIPRKYNRRNREEMFFPELAHLGEQEILKQEVYCDSTATDLEVLGYGPRWDEYRTMQDRICGKMRNHVPGALNQWHLSEHFTSHPTLSDTFLQDQTPVDRVVAVTGEPHFKGDMFFEYQHSRVMPTYSIPGHGNRL